jgi:hypothetical protein
MPRLFSLELDLLFLHQFPDVDQRVSHTTEGRIDTDAGEFGNFLETHVGIVAEDDDFPLLGREHIDQAADLFMGLAAHDALLGVVVAQAEHFEDVELIGGLHLGAPLGSTEIVHAQVVGDAHGPLPEFAFMVVFTFAEGVNNLDKDFLEDVFSLILILDEEVNRRVNFLLVTTEQFFECAFISIQIQLYQLLVVQRRNLHN